ncbi:hypothetical protein A33Q_3520 [Indibacter alkaliphilus LW1]|jgi:hypothetical protein|uniref:Uncharacterized protein n=1 Tax=Indibacter alkaliphilus (strain CCUG 57479 / KCTC 22604 / LW1) TaxID=1189612 RepID=S2D3X1_INDAL|nr:hypothetical protein [Indibacter alkaliphilus]EOZ93574.1 hypothetical protein A33Q_3520 [Indibacter alkaliphilus LW1]
MKSVEVMKWAGVIMLMIVFNIGVYAQSISTLRQNDVDMGRAFRFNPKSDGVKGTPFMYEEAPKAKIALKSGKVYDEIPVNIFLEKDEVYIQTGSEEDEPLLLKNWDWLETFEENPKLFRMEFLEGKERIVEILHEEGRDKYVALHKKNLVKPTNLKDGYTGPQYEVYRPDTRFYKINGLSSEEFKGNNKGLKELAGSKYGELRSYVKSNKINTDSAIGMKKVLTFLKQD